MSNNKLSVLEQRVSKLEKLIINEATRYWYEWEPNFDRAKKIASDFLDNEDINPDNLTMDDFKSKIVYDCWYLYGTDKLNMDSKAVKDILDKYNKFKTYDVKFSKFNNYIALCVKQKVRKSEWYDPEFGPGFDRDEYMSNKRGATWGKAQRDNRNWQ